MKITPEISALVEENRYFWKPEICSNFLDLLRGKYSKSRRNRGDLQERICFFNIFTSIFAYFDDFKIFPYVKQIINLSFRLK